MFKKSSTKLSVEVLEKCAPVIIIEKNALAKMKVYIDECADEIGWLGTATKEEGFYHITDVFLFEQEVHSTTTEITPEGLGDFGEKLLQQENGMEIWNSMKVWGHSHVNMSVSPSGQDNSQMEVFADNGHDFSIRIIGNKKGDMAVDLYDYETGVIYKNIMWYPNKPESERLIEEEIDKLEAAIEEMQEFLSEMDDKFVTDVQESIKAEMKIKVRKKGWGVVTTYTGKSQTYNDYVYKKIDDSKKKEEARGTEDDYSTTYLDYDDETGVYDYRRHADVDVFDTHGIDEYTLMELALALDYTDAEEILEIHGYTCYITPKEVVTLLNNLKSSKDYMFYAEDIIKGVVQ